MLISILTEICQNIRHFFLGTEICLREKSTLKNNNVGTVHNEENILYMVDVNVTINTKRIAAQNNMSTLHPLHYRQARRCPSLF